MTLSHSKCWACLHLRSCNELYLSTELASAPSEAEFMSTGWPAQQRLGNCWVSCWLDMDMHCLMQSLFQTILSGFRLQLTSFAVEANDCAILVLKQHMRRCDCFPAPT